MSKYNENFFFRKKKAMSKSKKRIKYFAVFLLLPSLFFTNCRRQEPEKNQKAVEDRLKTLEERVSILEKGISKLNITPSVQSVKGENAKADSIEKVEEAEKDKGKNIEPAKAARKIKPDSFKFPDYKLEIKKFKCIVGEGGIVQYFGEVVNSAEKNIIYLTLTTEFFDYDGVLIGGHSFPIKLILANSYKARAFSNADSVKNGFKNIYDYDVKVKYVIYEGGQLTEGNKFNE